MLYNTKVIPMRGKGEVYRSSFCKHFLPKAEWKINIENYIMYNSSVEIAVVY